MTTPDESSDAPTDVPSDVPSVTVHREPSPVVVRAAVDATVDQYREETRRAPLHDVYQALADRHGARSIVFGGLAAAAVGAVVAGRLLTR